VTLAASATGAWKRLHPLSPLVRAGPIVTVLVVGLGLSSAQGRSDGSARYVDLVVVAVVLLLGVVRWLVTRWALDGGTLRIETGLLRRDSRQLPVARIQAVDVIRPLMARVFGLAELRIRLAGSGSANGRLAYLPEDQALELRARLLAAHHNLDPSTPEPDEYMVATVSTDRLIGSVLLSGAVLVLPALPVLLVLVKLSSTAAVVFGGFVGTYALGFVQDVWRRISSQYGFKVANAPDGIRISRGLLSTVAETIPARRVQAVRMVQPLFWRIFGWCRLEVDVAGHTGREAGGGRSATTTKALLPVGPHATAELLIATVIGGHRPPASPPPRRARLKAPLSFHFLGTGHDDALVVSTTGRVRRTTIWVPLVKIQSIRRVQGPVQRRLGLATVHVDAAGRGVRAELRDRAVEEADELMVDLAALSRTARQHEQSAPLPTQAGWFPDPAGRHQLRYWDGTTWTPHVWNGDAAAIDPLDQPVASGLPGGPGQPGD
jgi:putative membrane protein